MFIVQAIWKGLKWLGAMLMPFLAKASDVRAIGHRFRWLIHALLVTGILAGLTFLNYALDVGKLLDTPRPFLRNIWLPLLFFLVYLLSWLGWWLWLLLGAEEASSSNPEIDAAWRECLQALSSAGVNLTEVPIYLLLGRPIDSVAALIQGAQLELLVEQVPRKADAPFQVYASAQAVYVACTECSLLGRQARLLVDDDSAVPVATETAASPDPEETQWNRTTQESIPVASSKRSSIQAGELTASNPELNPLNSSPGTLAESSPTVTVDEPAQTPRRRPARQPLLKNAVEVERVTARLKHLCWLILSERRPYCPLNGVLMLVPFEAFRSEGDANQTGLICQSDLAAIQEVMQIHCPVFTLVCDMDRGPGFREFVDRFPKGHRQRRLGQQFPFVANLTAAEGAQLVQMGVQWICCDLFPALIYRLMRLEKPGREHGSTMMLGNVRLYQLQALMRDRQRHLSRLLSLAIAPQTQGPILFGGCYFAGTGTNPAREQAFIAAVFQRLLENQNYVSWTFAAEVEEREYRRWKWLGYSALTVFAVSLLVFSVLLLFRQA